jgi:arginyl-tRNA synthetase
MNLLQLKTDLEQKTGYQFSLNKQLEQGVLSTNQIFIEHKKNQLTLEQAFVKVKSYIIQILTELKLEEEISIEQIGNYLNLHLSNNLVNSYLKNYSNVEQDLTKVFLEYVSPNVAKPLHAGHIRNMNIGESLRRMLNLKYPNLITDNHLGDWGVQFGKLFLAYKYAKQIKKPLVIILNDKQISFCFEDYNQKPFKILLYLYIWIEQNQDQFVDYDKLVRQEFIKLENKEVENYGLWQEFVQVSKGELDEDLKLFNVKPFDLQMGESYYEPYIKEVYYFMEQNSLWIKSQDPLSKARYIDFEALGMPSTLGFAYLVSSTGYSTYLFRDLIARIIWVREFGAKKMITVTGNEQKHHFEQFFAICEILSKNPITKAICQNYPQLAKNNLQHVSYGMLSLKGKNKMSTRKGVIIEARDLYNEVYQIAYDNLKARQPEASTELLANNSRVVAIASIKWLDLQKDSLRDVELDTDSILNFEGNTGVYQLYTIARINTLICKNIPVQGIAKRDLSLALLDQKQLAIVKKLLEYPIILNTAILTLKPHILVTYSFELANEFNSIYANSSLQKITDQETKNCLIMLYSQVKQILTNNLELLAIEHLESM